MIVSNNDFLSIEEFRKHSVEDLYNYCISKGFDIDRILSLFNLCVIDLDLQNKFKGE